MSSKPGTRTLYLPSGGTMEIPLPGSGGKFTVNPGTPSVLSSAEACPHLAPTILIGVTIGVLVGAAATAWWLHRK